MTTYSTMSRFPYQRFLQILSKQSGKRHPIQLCNRFFNSNTSKIIRVTCPNVRSYTSTSIEMQTKQEHVHHDHQHHQQQQQTALKNTRYIQGYQSESSKPRPIPQSSWVFIPRVPRQATLDDLLNGIQLVVQQELERGILDLDKLAVSIQNQQQDQENGGLEDNDHPSPLIRYWKNDDQKYPPHLVLEARSHLEKLKKHTGWFLRFPNRSVVHALLEHSDHVSRIHVGYFPLTLYESPDGPHIDLSRRHDAELLKLNDCVVRLDHVPYSMNETHVYELFKEYELDYYGARPPIEWVVRGTSKEERGGKIFNKQREKPIVDTPPKWNIGTHTFFIRFVSASDARAAIRDLQGTKLGSHNISLSQYPRQILPN